MGLFVLVLFSLLTLTCFGQSSDKHMICKDVGDVFTDVTSTDLHTRRRIGPAGKRGIKGERGFPGSKGQTGEVNDERIQEIVRATLVEETQALKVKVEETEAQIQKLEENPETQELKVKVGQMEAQIRNLEENAETRALKAKVEEMKAQIQKLEENPETQALKVKVGQMEAQIQNLEENPETQALKAKVEKMELQIQKLEENPETQALKVKVGQMEAKIQNLEENPETQALKVKVGQMEVQIQNMEENPVMCKNGVRHGGRCYWTELHSSQDTNYAKAREICAKKRSRPADISGKNHYDKIINYLRRYLGGRSYIYVWTGMRKQHRNNVAQLSNGTPAPYTRQRNDRTQWENAENSRSHVYLKVKSSTTDPDNGMGALWPTWESHGALCQTE